MYSNDYDENEELEEMPKKKVLKRRPPRKEEDEINLFDETETNSNERGNSLPFEDDEDETSSNESNQFSESNNNNDDFMGEVGSNEEVNHDELDEVIPFMESLEDGVYTAKITSVKSTKNEKVMISFSVKVDDQFYYSLFCFFEKYALKGNLTYRLLNAFGSKNLSFNQLLKQTLFISVRVNRKEGKTYENIVDFISANDHDIDDLKVDKYGRFIL